MVLERTSPPLWSATPDPVPSPPSPRCAECEPELTANGEPEHVTTDKPSLRSATELRIATEPEPHGSSDQVREPATTPATREKATDSVSAERSSAPCTAAEGELSMARQLCHTEDERVPVPELSPEWAPIPELSPEKSPVPDFRPESPEAHKFPPSHLLLPHPPLSSGIPSALPQPTIYAVRALWDCQTTSSHWSEYPLTLPQASKLRTPPQPVDLTTPPWLLAPSSLPWPICPLASLGSLIPPAPPWSVVDHPAPRYSTPPAAPRPSGSIRLLHPFGSSSVLCRSGSTVAIWITVSASVASTICSALVPRILPVALAHRLSVSASGSSTTCSAAVGRPPGVISPSSTMAPPSIGSTVGRHYGCGLGPTWHRLLQAPPDSSLALSSPPWTLSACSPLPGGIVTARDPVFPQSD